MSQVNGVAIANKLHTYVQISCEITQIRISGHHPLEKWLYNNLIKYSQTQQTLPCTLTAGCCHLANLMT